MNRFVIVSGCSGGGKSTLVDELARQGYATIAEPGRRIVQSELGGDGAALPWVDPIGFARRAIEMSLEDRAKAASLEGWVFFDRGLIDATAALEYLTGEPALQSVCRPHQYHGRVFLTPPWREIYLNDAERRHGFEDAVLEYHRLLAAYPALGYDVTVLPRIGVKERADFLLKALC